MLTVMRMAPSQTRIVLSGFRRRAARARPARRRPVAGRDSALGAGRRLRRPNALVTLFVTLVTLFTLSSPCSRFRHPVHPVTAAPPLVFLAWRTRYVSDSLKLSAFQSCQCEAVSAF